VKDITIIVAVGAVIKDIQGRLLLVRHKPEREGYWKGKWICPGGKLNLGEDIQSAIIREVAEETHLQIRLTTPLIPFERIVKEGSKTMLHVIYIDYLAEYVSGELEPDDDVGEALWVTSEELRTKYWKQLHEDTQRLFKLAGIA
jgi:8-oxo-dGTP diphosphatase